MIGLLLSIATLIVGHLTRPELAACPVGWTLSTGVQRDGSFACYLYSSELRGVEWPPLDTRPIALVAGRVWCRPTDEPTTDGATVRCTKRRRST